MHNIFGSVLPLAAKPQVVELATDAATVYNLRPLKQPAHEAIYLIALNSCCNRALAELYAGQQQSIAELALFMLNITDRFVRVHKVGRQLSTS